MSRRGLYTIAPHAPFLSTLADRILDGTLPRGWDRSGPFWLSDVTIILPTRRARLALSEVFAERLGGAALLPDIRTLGGEATDEEPFLPPIEAPVEPEPASMLERRLVLAQLVAAFANSPDAHEIFSSPPNPAEILWLADSLGALIDDLEVEGISHRALRELVPAELAANWQQIVKFLEIVLSRWPKILKERGKGDAVLLRNARLHRQAATVKLLYGERPVIAAGSTGSMPATAGLLKAIARLRRGAVVLPGLDVSLSPTQHEALLMPGANTHGHPQYGMARLLRHLGAGIGDVEELAPTEAPRTAIVRAALALADETPGWPKLAAAIEAPAMDEALAGVAILAAPNADLEARAVALAARTALGAGQSVGIVTPDQTLARRIAAELRRFEIETDDPAGTPLYQSAAGRLARLVLASAASRLGAVDLMALLHHNAVTLGLERAELSRRAGLLEFKLLRGQFLLPGIAGLRARLERAALNEEKRAPQVSEDDVSALHDLFDRLEQALAPVSALIEAKVTDAPSLAEALAAAMEGLAWAPQSLPGFRELDDWAEELVAHAEDATSFAPINLDGVLSALMAGTTVRNTLRRRDDIFIWGTLEARLQNPGLMIVAGLNEGIWPAAADPGPWLSRKMRLDIGLEPPERQQGQAAHDFEMAMGNRQVLLAYALRLGTSPALPSRLLQRFDGFVGEARAGALRARGAKFLLGARQLDRAQTTRAAPIPQPRPPAEARPRRLSVTEIETLLRSPYDLYAKHVLKLRRIEPLGATPDARERGSMIHEVFARFVEGYSVKDPDAAAILMRLAAEAFAGLDAIGEQRDIWLRRFADAADAFLAYERDRDPRVCKRHAERKGVWVFPELGGFTLSGIADRLDLMADGTLEIIDFKTGSVPSAKDMRNFDAPQLLLEAAMAKAGAFEELTPASASALTYIKIGLGPEAFTETPFKLRDGQSLADAADEVSRRMQGHVAALLLTDVRALVPRIRPAVNQTWRGDYEHLARTDEWTLTIGSGAE